MFIEPEKLKKFLLDSGLVKDEDIAEAEREAGKGKRFKNVGEYFVVNEKIEEDDLRRIEAYILGIPFIDVGSENINYETLSIIPEPIARKHNIVSYKRNDTSLEVAMVDTDDLGAIDFIQKKTGLKILPRLTSTKSLKLALINYQKSLKADLGDVINVQISSIKDVDGEKEEDLKKIAQDLPVIKIVDTLLKHAVLQNASDIHIEPQENDLLIRYRVDGILHDAMILPKKSSLSITARIKVLANLKLDEKRLPQDGRFKTGVYDEQVSFRVSILPTNYGEKTVLRILREDGSVLSLEALGFHGDALERIHKALKQKTGLILTTGPTGSGKTTTLYTLLDILNTPEVNISTIEDPIEYQMKRVNQTQVKPKIGFSFADGLRSLVRQDPDIIMVGEIRDTETASLAVNASLTGHLVLSTLHTNSSAGTIPRLIDMSVEPFLLTSTLKVIIAQRLVRKIGPKKESYLLSKPAIENLKKNANMDLVLETLKNEKVVSEKATWEQIPFYRPKKDSEDDGYKGRVGIYEVLEITDSINQLILGSKTADEIEKIARNGKMLTMFEDGIFKAASGLTTLEEILRVVSE
jgi:type IV pilus assembly protein PilB